VRWGVVEGEADRFEDAIEIVEHVIVPEAKHTISAVGEFQGAAIVCGLAERMLAAVELDGELCSRTRKIDDAAADRMLASKFP
jgi:hypothetical protein